MIGAVVKGLSGAVKTILVMPQNFIACDRDQALLMPPSLRDWLPEDHLVWTLLAAVERDGSDGFYGAYRDGRAWAGRRMTRR